MICRLDQNQVAVSEEAYVFDPTTVDRLLGNAFQRDRVRPYQDIHVVTRFRPVARVVQPSESRRHAVCLNRAPEILRVPQQAGHGAARRSLPDRVRRFDLHDASAVHDRDPVGQFERLIRIVRNHDGDAARLTKCPPRVFPQLPAQGCVDTRERLVKQHDARRGGQCASQGNALLLSARQRVRVTFGELAQAHGIQTRLRNNAALARIKCMQAEGDVFQRCPVGEQHGLLEHETDPSTLRSGVPPGFAQYLAVEANLAGLDSFETGRHAQQRALAAAGNPEQAGDFARSGRKRDPVEDHVLAIAVAYFPEFQAHGRAVYADPGRWTDQVIPEQAGAPSVTRRFNWRHSMSRATISAPFFVHGGG